MARKGGFRDRIGGYAQRRVLWSAQTPVWDLVRATTPDVSGLGEVPAGYRGLWRGPATEQDGRSLYAQRVRPLFSDEAAANQAARALWAGGVVLLVMAAALGLFAIITPSGLFKISAVIGLIMLSVTAMMNLHRSSQIRQRRIFGLREMF